MKRIISLILVFVICLGCVGCGSSTDSNKTGKELKSAFEVPENVQMYAPGTTLKTDFGSITVMDAAFCEKAQIYYTKNSTSSKTTINGQTTESYEETIYPGYISVMENKMIFALKTVLTNNSGEDIEIHNLEVKAFFADSAVYFSKGGNYDISDEAYNVLPDGESGEYILAALLPVEQYQKANGCILEVGGAELGFTYDSINVYNALGFQAEDNSSANIDTIIQTATNGASSVTENNENTAATEAAVVEAKYYREANELPTVDSITGLELSHSASDSYNGTITRMRYYYDAPSGVKNAPEMIDQYLAYLKENGYTVTEDGINVEVSLDGNPLASIVIMGTMMEVGIDIGQKNQKNTEVPAVKEVSAGDTITLDFVEIKVDGIHRAYEIKEDDGPDTYHRKVSNSNNQMFWLETTMKNVGTETFGIWGINKYFAEITFDGTYTYEASIDKMVGMGNTELTPFESAKVYIWAEIPIEMLDKYKDVVIRFAFNDNFDKSDKKEFDSMKNRFEFSS